MLSTFWRHWLVGIDIEGRSAVRQGSRIGHCERPNPHVRVVVCDRIFPAVAESAAQHRLVERGGFLNFASHRIGKRVWIVDLLSEEMPLHEVVCRARVPREL